MKKFVQSIAVTCFSLMLVMLCVTDGISKEDRKVYNGYVALKSGDTLHGKIQMLSPTLNEVKVKLITETGKKKIYKAKHIASYGFETFVYNRSTGEQESKWIYYVNKRVKRSPVPFGPRNVLVEHQERGTINMYNHYVETRTDNQPLKHFKYVERDGEMIRITRKNYRNTLKSMMKDYPELCAKIGTAGFGYRYIARTIKQYNQTIIAKGLMLSHNS